MKILIVEDDTLLLQGLILAAQTEGYACDGVSTARMAEQSLEAGHYSLVVLDLGLPDEDGLHGNDSNLLIVFYVQIMPDDFVMQLHRF